MLKVK